MSLSTLDPDSFSRYYRQAHQQYLKLDLMQLQELRCRLSQAFPQVVQRYNYDVRFWANYYAADDAYYQRWAKSVGFKGASDSCTWPGRGEGVRVLSRSGKVLYASVDLEEPAYTPAQRRRVSEGRVNARAGADS